MQRIFISYRRNDSGSITGRIYDHLKASLPGVEIFKDVQSIPSGVDFLEYTKDKLSQSEIFIPIIGKSWASSLQERKEDPNDFVRIEVEQALKQDLSFIPIYVEGAKSPKVSDIPDTIEKISFYNGITVRPDPDFQNDVQKLVDAIKQKIGDDISKPISAKPTNFKKILIPIIVLALILVSTMFLLKKSDSPTEKTQEEEVAQLICDKHLTAAIIAEFSKGDEDAFSNTVATKVDGLTLDTEVSVRTANFEDRNVDRYADYIRTKYFTETCDTAGIFVNGLRNERKKILNVYSTLSNFEIKRPDYIETSSIVMSIPKELVFDMQDDSDMLAELIVLYLSSTYDTPKSIIKKSFEYQEKYNLTKESQEPLKGKSILGPLYLLRADQYAVEGNNERAKKLYTEAGYFGNEEISRVSKINKKQAQPIADYMYADSDLRNIRALNVQEHKRIEKGFEKFVSDVKKVFNSILNEFRKK